MFKASKLWLWHEYAMLMRRCFPMLLPDQTSDLARLGRRGPRGAVEQPRRGQGSDRRRAASVG